MGKGQSFAGSESKEAESFLLDELHESCKGPVVVMVCRKWDVINVKGKYLSTDYVMSDKKGNVIHCVARNNIAHRFKTTFEEGCLYCIRGFSVVRNSDNYRIMKDAAYIIHLEGTTIVRKASDDLELFNRYPFELVPFNQLTPTDNKFFVDVIGYVTIVGQPSRKSGGNQTVEFNLTNERGHQLGVTLWGTLGDDMLGKKSRHPAAYTIILTSMTCKEYQGNLCLSSSSSTPKNADAAEINNALFDKLDRPSYTYKSADEICKASTDTLEQEELYLVEFLNSLTFSGMPPHELHLKEGLPVMLLRNVNPSQGLCNGTRLLITNLGKFIVKARIITGSKVGESALIPRITMSSTKSKWPFILKRRQFPIKPCYAMTINKSQGQTLDFVGLYLPNPVFSHGQLYVALSRVRNPEGLKILMIPDRDPNFKQHTRNIVFKEVFNNLLLSTN